MSTSAAASAGVRKQREAEARRRATSGTPAATPSVGQIGRRPTNDEPVPANKTYSFLKKMASAEPAPKVHPSSGGGDDDAEMRRSPNHFKTPTGAATSVEDTMYQAKLQQEALGVARKHSLATRLLTWWVIDPRTSKYLGYWDIVTIVALLFVALVTPFEVAFLEAPRDAKDIWERFESVGWLFCVNRLVDCLFTVDLVLQFRLMYTENASTEVSARMCYS